ncbi:tail fiber domain-containing protein [Reichenbachiella sp.]|uniref:tail fiber domain-containing protein n=1 Tax=Reichenbachiella sp. TaxID=2184521 RepID=UPI003B5CE47D
MSAQNQRIPFQGTLYQSGTAVQGTVNITFTIADPVWTETHENVSVTQGVYAVVLGETTPFPDDMFTTGETPQVVVNIGGTDVAIVDLHAPYISEAIVGKNIPGQIERTFDEDGTEFNGLTIVVDGAGDAQTAAFEGVAQSLTQNTGVEGFAVSGAGNVDTQNGLYGQAAGDGTGNHRGVMGYGAGAGKYNHGLKGYAAGAGNGDTGQGYGEGSINFGVEGNATGNAWNNTGVEGSNFGTEGVWNFGVHGISNAGTGTEVENTGVAGKAFGSGINYGVYGLADGGEENWAGYFDGDVKVTGTFSAEGSLEQSSTSESGQTDDQVTMSSVVSGDGSGRHYGMIIDASSAAGRQNNGIRADAHGPGRPEGEGYSANRGGDFWGYGNQQDNIGVQGIANGDAGNNNYGGFFNAYATTGTNYGIRASASGGVENWAGYFDGDVNVDGELMVNGESLTSLTTLPDTLNSVNESTEPGRHSAVEGISKTTGWNSGVEGYAESLTGNGEHQTGVYGVATGTGEGKHRGVVGVSQGGGKYNHGIFGNATGAGNGDTGQGYGEGSINFGVEGSSSGNAWNNTGVEGSNYGTEGVWNFGVHGISNAGTGTEVENTGVAGKAFGSGINYGVYGLADGGEENYAGYFEGDLVVNNGRFSINNANGDQSIRMGDFSGGSMYAYNDVGANTGWFGNTGNNGFMQLVDYDDTGADGEGAILAGFWAGRPEFYMELANGEHLVDLGIQDEKGYFWLRGLDGSELSMDSHGIHGLSEGVFGSNGHDYVNIGAQTWEGNNGDQRGFVHLSGTDDGLSTGDKQRAYFEVKDYGSGSFGILGLKNSTDDGEGNGLTTVFLNGENGDASFNGNVHAGSFESNGDNDSRMGIGAGGINMGQNAYSNGIVMNYDNMGGGVFEMYSGDTQQVFLNGNNGDASFQGTAWANFFESPNGFNSSSDARFKKNVKSIDGALAKTQQLNGYTYNWNKLAAKQKGITNKEEQVGVLAQELEAVFPQLVKTDDEGYKSVNYAALTAVLIEAVKELSEQVTNLQGENAELKAELTKVDELEIKIDLIQKLLAKQTMEASQATVSR